MAHLRRWDGGLRGRQLLEARPLQLAAVAPEPQVRELAATLDLAAALTAVDPDGGSYVRGGDAVLAIALRLPGGEAVRPWLAVGPFRSAVRALYRVVARARPSLVALGLGDHPADRAADPARGGRARLG